MSCMAIMAVIVFVALFFFKAGYGYLSTSNWGPKISNKTAWVLMEAPAFCFMLYYTLKFAFSGVDTGNSNVVLYIMAGFYLLHYFQRSFIFPLKIVQQKQSGHHKQDYLAVACVNSRHSKAYGIEQQENERRCFHKHPCHFIADLWSPIGAG